MKIKLYKIYLGNEEVFQTEDKEEADMRCKTLNEAYRANDYQVVIEFEEW